MANDFDGSMGQIIDLHRLFLEMRERTSLAERRELSFRLVLHRASMERLRAAAVECCQHADRADVLQDAMLLLVQKLSAESLRYVDQGADDFGGWYWTVGYSACRNAAYVYQNARSQSFVYVDPDHLEKCPQTLQANHPADVLSRAIARLPEGPEKNAILDWKAGMTAVQSGRYRRIPLRTMHRLRQRGRLLVLELCAGDADSLD